MKVLVALLAALSVTLGVIVYQLESRPPEVVQLPPVEELPWAIFIDVCGDFTALIWTTEQPTWFMADANFSVEQKAKMDEIMEAEQYQLVNLDSVVCAKIRT